MSPGAYAFYSGSVKLLLADGRASSPNDLFASGTATGSPDAACLRERESKREREREKKCENYLEPSDSVFVPSPTARRTRGLRRRN